MVNFPPNAITTLIIMAVIAALETFVGGADALKANWVPQAVLVATIILRVLKVFVTEPPADTRAAGVERKGRLYYIFFD